MNSRTYRWLGATAVLCVLLLVATWFLLIGPRRAEAAELSDKQVAAEQENRSLESEIAQLKEQAGQLPNRQADLKALQEQFPQIADMPKLVRDLAGMAELSGVQLREIVPGAPTVLALSGGSATTAPGAGATPSGAAASTTSTGGSAYRAPAPVSGGAAAPSAGGPLVGIPMKIVVGGDYFQVAVFVKKLQTEMRRAFLVTTVDITPDEDSGGSGGSGSGSASTGTDTVGDVKLTLSGLVYVFQPQTAGTAAASTGGTAGLSTGATTGASSETAATPRSGGENQ